MSKFTEGLWLADQLGEMITAKNDNTLICEVRCESKGQEETDANVRLISHAPAMYHALAKIYNMDECPHCLGYQAQIAAKMLNEVDRNERH